MLFRSFSRFLSCSPEYSCYLFQSLQHSSVSFESRIWFLSLVTQKTSFAFLCFLHYQTVIRVALDNNRRTVICVAPGIYKQLVYVPKTKNLITLAGLRPEDTVLTWHNTTTQIDHHQVFFFLALCTTISYICANTPSEFNFYVWFL